MPRNLRFGIGSLPIGLVSGFLYGLMASLALATPSTSPLFMVDTPFDQPQVSKVYLLDPTSGELTEKADLGTTWSPILGLAAASESVLYATATDNTGTSCTEDGCLLLRIELDPSSTTPLSVTEIGAVVSASLPVGKITGLNFRQDGVLYALSQGTGGLYTVDLSTALAPLIGLIDVDIHGGDITFVEDDRLFLWTNIGAASGLYELDPETAQASAYELHPGLSFAGLAALGHKELMYGTTPPSDYMKELGIPMGMTGIEFPLTLNAAPFDHKRGDLDSPFCTNDAACADTEICTDDACSPGGCTYLDLDLGQLNCGIGACARTVSACQEGSSQTCSPGYPSGERCDGIDNDCDGIIDNNISSAGPSPELDLTLQSPDDVLTWEAVSAETGYNIVRGDAGQLHQNLGDFSQSLSACVAVGLEDTSIESPVVPASGMIMFYLVEPTSCTGGPGYDSLGPGQLGSRDDGINSSPSACP